MISQVVGKVTEVGENSITLQVDRFCYEILVPGSIVNSYRKKLKDGKSFLEEEPFYTIQYIEGASGHGNQFVRLVGFKRMIEKDFFQLYTSVEGIGYKTALKSLMLPIQKIALAIENNDFTTLKKLPHIGSRTAEKMVATLRGRMKKFILDEADQPLSADLELDFKHEVVQVLVQVGYNLTRASELIEEVLRTNPAIKSAEQMIQEIFRIKNKV